MPLRLAHDSGRVGPRIAHKLLAAPLPRRWSTAEVQTFLTAASEDRLHVAWRLSLYGLRRGEVLGLRWSDIDLNAKTVTINQSRVLVDYTVRIEPPKTERAERTLPLDDELVLALKDLRKRQTTEAAAAGPAYQ